MKVIDVLNKVLNDEIKFGTKLKYKNHEIILKESTKGFYLFDPTRQSRLDSNNDGYWMFDILTDEIEIIEEDKPIELPKKIKVAGCNIKILNEWIPTEDMVTDEVVSKVNEIIDYLNQKESEDK